MKILILCGEEATENQLAFARLLGATLRKGRHTCLVGGNTPFVQALASSGVSCLGHTIRREGSAGHTTIECADLCSGDFPKPEEAWGARIGIFLTKPDAYVLVGKSEDPEGTLRYTPLLLLHNKARENPVPFVIVDRLPVDMGRIRYEYGLSPDQCTWLHSVPFGLDAHIAVPRTLQHLGI